MLCCSIWNHYHKKDNDQFGHIIQGEDEEYQKQNRELVSEHRDCMHLPILWWSHARDQMSHTLIYIAQQ